MCGLTTGGSSECLWTCDIQSIDDPIQQGISVVHLDVEDFSEELLWCLLCHKEPARRNQSPLLGFRARIL